MFIHWGLYAIPAGTWEGEEHDGIGEWIMAHADIPVEDYEKLAPQFNPVKFDADQWAKLAADAGMKYLVITSKHHDGFCLFDTKATDWDVMDATPFKRDILKELKEACDRHGVKFCTYYSILDWHHPAQDINKDGEHNYWNNTVIEDRRAEYKEYMKKHLTELVENYEIGVLWFDGGWMDWWGPEDGKEIYDFLWDLDPHLVINNRAAGGDAEGEMGDYLTPEQWIPSEDMGKDWESCMTMNDTWGYKANDDNWKSTESLLFGLLDIVSKGGNFLLNVGPTDEGLIPEASIDRLTGMGEWLAVNGEAVYGTTAWKIQKEGPNMVKVRDSYRDDEEEETENDEEIDEENDEGDEEEEGDDEDEYEEEMIEVEYTSEDFLFTMNEDVIYAICLNWPDDGTLTVKSLGLDNLPDHEIGNVSLLGSDSELEWTQEADGLNVELPADRPCDYAYVLKIK